MNKGLGRYVMVSVTCILICILFVSVVQITSIVLQRSEPILPQLNNISMTLSTSFSFIVVSGMILSMMIGHISKSSSIQGFIQLILPLLSLFIIFLIMPLALQGIVYSEHILDLLYMNETVPSYGTSIAFIFIAIIGWMYTLRLDLSVAISKGVAICVSILGLIAIIGYIVEYPVLYYRLPANPDRGMAVITAMLFILSGIAFSMLLYAERKRVSS